MDSGGVAVSDDWNKLNGVKALVESGAAGVPSFYIKPPEFRPVPEELYHDFEKNEVPVIDVLDLLPDSPRRSSIISQLLDASIQWGFLQVVNHGVDSALIQQMIDVAYEFFAMPLEEKMAHYGTELDSPLRYGTSFNPLKEEFLDWHDNLLHRFLPEHDQPHPWPTKPASYRKVAEEFIKQTKFLAKELLRGLSEGLGLEGESLEEALGQQQVALRLNYYPPCPAPELVMGLSGHSDSGGLTVLLQDQVPGLQVKRQGRWKTVNPIPGALVINIGDQLQVFTNGRLKSVEHRAVVNSMQARVSIGLFWDPSSDVVVAPITKLLQPNERPLYRPSRFGDHIEKLFSTELVGKKWVESLKLE